MAKIAEPFIKNIYARVDFRLATEHEVVDMKATEDRLVRFGSEADYKSLLELNLFVECINSTLPEPIVNPITMPIPVADAPVLDTQTSDETKIITQQEDDILCPKCDCLMILSIDTSDPKDIKDVMYCPGCTYAYETGTRPADHVSAPPEVTPAPQPAQNADSDVLRPVISSIPPSDPPAKQTRTMSRCECGKVKAATALKCKTCAAGMAGDEQVS